MKTRTSKRIWIGCVLCWAVWTAGPRASARTPPNSGPRTDAGLDVSGAVGAFYSVEFVTDAAQTNANHWLCLAFVQLPGANYKWIDPTAPATGRRFYRAVLLDAPANMAFIPPGDFQMGSPTNEAGRDRAEGPPTAVTISRAFWVGRFLVTQREYQAAMGVNPAVFTGDLTRPVESVSWSDASIYCGRVTHRERAAGRIPANSVYRLPTEAEWEYVCRAGTSTRFSHGDDPDYATLAKHAWYRDNSAGTTHPVGQKPPNPWGLYDMNGNVFEWCQDWSGPYHGGTALDPQGPAAGSGRVFRGGLWDGGATYCRSAFRGHSNPASRTAYIGFRVVLVPSE